jgi:hypothetical protein
MNLSTPCSNGCACPWSACPTGSPGDGRRRCGLHHHHAGDRSGSWRHRERAGACPCQRERPALPRLVLPWSGLDTAPTVPCIPDARGAAHPSFRRKDAHSPDRGRRAEHRHRGTCDLTALAGLHLDVVDDRADRHAEAASHCPASRRPFRRRQPCRRRQTLRSQDVGLLAVVIGTSAMKAVRFGSYSIARPLPARPTCDA